MLDLEKLLELFNELFSSDEKIIIIFVHCFIFELDLLFTVVLFTGRFENARFRIVTGLFGSLFCMLFVKAHVLVEFLDT